MSLDEALRDLEEAIAALRQARDTTNEWSDEVRCRFDQQRLMPLDEAGVQLTSAILRAQDAVSDAQRLVAD